MTAWLVGFVWCSLALAGALAPRLGGDVALCGAYLASAALLLAVRQRRATGRASLARVALAGSAGFVSFPAWLACVGALGVALGLSPPTPSPSAAGATGWLAHVVLAPVFEELLYRERLLEALRRRLAAPPALVLSSAAFAAPHLEPWSMLATFCVGLVLGRLQLATGSVVLCMAHHAGLNLAALACGMPPARFALPPLAAALAAAVLLGLARGRRAGSPAWPSVHAAHC